MSFSNLPLVWGLLGALAIAGILYLLQRLRVRHQLVEVETTLFWQQAMEESRARVLVQRFRHPWAYLLILAIALLLWLSVAGLRGGGDAQRDHVVLLDGSAAMAIGERFPEVVALANDYVGALPEDARTVVFADGQSFEFALESRGSGAAAAGDGAILAPMPGKVIAVDVAAGDTVTAGQRLMVLEAMKMEHALTAPFDGTVTELAATEGGQVQVEAVLCVVEPAEE